MCWCAALHCCVAFAIPTATALSSEYARHKAYVNTWTAEYYDKRHYNSSVDFFEAKCEEHANSTAIKFVGGSHEYTYRQWDERANQLAHTFIQLGYGTPGRVAALYMENCPEFLFTWLALGKLGIPVAMLNTSLKNRQLLHALNVAKANFLIVSTKYQHVVQDAKHLFEAGEYAMDITFPTVHVAAGAASETAQHNSTGAVANSSQSLDELAATHPTTGDFRSYRAHVTIDDPMFYIYTSGTTGPSKAALFSHRRVIGAGLTWASPMQLSQHDNYYIVLPLYHG